MISFEHTAHLWGIALAVLLAALLGAFSARRKLRGVPIALPLFAFYAAVLAILFWCLLLPGYKQTRTLLIKPRFVIALDTSKSMLARREEGAESRWDRAIQALSLPWIDAVGAEALIEVYPFSDGLSARMEINDALSIRPEGNATHLRDALRDIAARYAGLNVAALLLLSDGHDTREAFDDWASDPFPFPIHTARLEDDVPWTLDPDLRIEGVTTPRRVTSGRQSELRVAVSGDGTLGQPVTLQLFRDGTRIDEQPLLIPAEGGRREAVFTLQNPEVGLFSYRLALPALPGEKEPADNEYNLTVSVLDPRNRLLYVEGVPRFEYRFLRRALLANEQIVPLIFYSAADGTPRSGGAVADPMGADMTEQDLLRVKIVILGNLSADELTERRAANLVRFVEAGGSLVLLGGTRGWGENGFLQTSLRQVAPVRSHGTRVMEGKIPFATALTPSALAHPSFSGDESLWAVLPPVLSVYPDADPQPGAEVLVTAETPNGAEPLLISQRYGQGRVTAIFTDSLWRWQLTPETDERPYARFWTQLISWKLPDEEEAKTRGLHLFSDRDVVHIGETVEFSARWADADETGARGPPRLKLLAPDGRATPFDMEARDVLTPDGKRFPGYTLRYTPETPGIYTATATFGVGAETVSSDSATVSVRPYSPEMAPRPIREDILERLAGAGRRHYESLDELDRMLRNLPFSVQEETRSEHRTLWRNWPVLVLLMVLLAAMWMLRKARNLP